MFGKNKAVNIALSENMASSAAHGVLWARKANVVATDAPIHNSFAPVNFRADRPQLLNAPKRATIKSIYEQATALGLELLHIELHVDGEKKLFALS